MTSHNSTSHTVSGTAGTPRSLGQLAIWGGLSFATAAIGAIASVEAKSFYAALSQPGWAPPAGAFGPVWTTLFVMMAFAAWQIARVSKQAPPTQRTSCKVALGLFVAQLIVNALWSWLFFAWQLGAAAFADVLLLWGLIAVTLVVFWRINRLAGLLMVPYLLWVTLASALTWSVWQANPALLG